MTYQLEAGSIILTPIEARMLYQAASIGDLRNRYRVGNSAIYRLLTDISIAAFSTDANNGNLPRQETASEERRTWTVQQLSKATNRAPRTIRLDIETDQLPAVKQGTAWVITANDATTYIESRKSA